MKGVNCLLPLILLIHNGVSFIQNSTDDSVKTRDLLNRSDNWSKYYKDLYTKFDLEIPMIGNLFNEFLIDNQLNEVDYAPEDQEQILSETLKSISDILPRLIFDKNCKFNSQLLSYDLLDESLSNYLINKKLPARFQNEALNLTSNAIATLFEDVRHKRRCMGPYRHRIEKHILNKMDPELKQFLSMILTISREYYKNNNKKDLHMICENTFNLKKIEDINECKKLGNIVLELILKDYPAKRSRRDVSVYDDTRRDGSSSYSSYPTQHKSPSYKQTEYIIISDDEHKDLSALPLIALASVLALGTYGALFYLAFDTFSGDWFTHAGIKGDKGDEGISGIKGMTGILGMDGVDGDIGSAGVVGGKGTKGDQWGRGGTGGNGGTGGDGLAGDAGQKGEKGLQGVDGDDGPRGPSGADTIGTKGAKGQPGQPGRRRRSNRNNFGQDYFDIVDSAQMLDSLRRRKGDIMLQKQGKTSPTTLEYFNRIWRESRRKGCGSCVLFDVLKDMEDLNVEPYIISAFSHALGNEDSMELLGKLKEAKKRGKDTKCESDGKKCNLVYR